MPRLRLIWLWLLVIPVLAGRAFAAETDLQFLLQDATVKNWTKADGLPGDSLTAILQTRDDYLWVGTTHGLARFDGLKFSPVNDPDFKTNTPLNITTLFADDSGRLWVGTQDHGLFVYQNGALRPDMESQLADQTVNCIAQDKTKALWVGTSSGLFQLRQSATTRFTQKDGLPGDVVMDVRVARSGDIWITTRNGMCQFQDGKIIPFELKTQIVGRSPEFIGVYASPADVSLPTAVTTDESSGWMIYFR